ncbi:hypothetical protein CapIbe_021510 [Capra ibex]
MSGQKELQVWGRPGQLFPALWDPMDCSRPSSSVHGISQDSPGKNSGVDCQGSNPCLLNFLHWQSTVTVTTKGPRVDFLPSTGLQEELELWYQQWPLAPICLLGVCRRIWDNKMD